jgi:hypothetical protein
VFNYRRARLMDWERFELAVHPERLDRRVLGV